MSWLNMANTLFTRISVVRWRQMELCRPQLNWTSLVTVAWIHMLLDTFFFFNFLARIFFFSIYSCFISHLVFPWVHISGWLLEDFRFMTRNLKWTLSTAQESNQTPNIFAYNYLIISSHSLNSWAAHPSPFR